MKDIKKRELNKDTNKTVSVQASVQGVRFDENRVLTKLLCIIHI
jgi:hypothetical protein